MVTKLFNIQSRIYQLTFSWCECPLVQINILDELVRVCSFSQNHFKQEVWNFFLPKIPNFCTFLPKNGKISVWRSWNNLKMTSVLERGWIFTLERPKVFSKYLICTCQEFFHKSETTSDVRSQTLSYISEKSGSQRPHFWYGSTGHLEGSYKSYKVQIPT